MRIATRDAIIRRYLAGGSSLTDTLRDLGLHSTRATQPGARHVRDSDGRILVTGTCFAVNDWLRDLAGMPAEDGR